EVNIGESPLLVVPTDQAFTAVRTVTDRMQDAHDLAVEGAFPAGDIDCGLCGFGIFEFAPPGFAEERPERFEMFVQRGVLRRRCGGDERTEEEEDDCRMP